MIASQDFGRNSALRSNRVEAKIVVPGIQFPKTFTFQALGVIYLAGVLKQGVDISTLALAVSNIFSLLVSICRNLRGISAQDLGKISSLLRQSLSSLRLLCS